MDEVGSDSQVMQASSSLASSGSTAAAGSAAATGSSSGQWLQGAGQIAAAAGKIASGFSSASQSSAQASALNYRAAQEREQAIQADATAQAQAKIDYNDTKKAIGSARAIAAASGGSATDVNVINDLGKIQARGNFKAASALYAGQERADGLNDQASLDNWMATQAKKAGTIQETTGILGGAGSLMKGVSTLYSKYGNDGPPTTNSGTTTQWAGDDQVTTTDDSVNIG